MVDETTQRSKEEEWLAALDKRFMALAMIATLSAAFTWGQESILWRLGPNPREGMEFDHPDGRVVLVAMREFSAWVAAADAIERASIGDSFYLALFTGQRQTDRLIMRDESCRGTPCVPAKQGW